MQEASSSLFKWPGSLKWLFPLAIAIGLFIYSDQVGSFWWYIMVPPLVALTFIDLFTTVWFGITILISLFLYCSIGSSGVPTSFAILKPTSWLSLREIRGLEMTEFEWFHWWPFKWLIATLCLNMSIVTVRKIKLTKLTIGVWAIHSGVITLVLGCLVYFTQKIEGDVLLSRARVAIEIPGEEVQSMVVTPNNSIQIGPVKCTISNVSPAWELMSGDDKGIRTYAVSITLESESATFTRQLFDGYPQYTEDSVKTDDPNQPMARAKNVLGTALVDDSIVMRLERDPKDIFYVTQSASLYLRELNPDTGAQTPWTERPIHNLPRFNDYVSRRDEVWGASHPQFDLDPLAIDVAPLSSGDPIKQNVRVTDYLRYAVMDPQIVAGGENLNPVAWATLRKNDLQTQTVKLFAFDPDANTADNSLMTLKWLESEEELLELEGSLFPTLTATIDETTYSLEVTNNPEFAQISETEYAYRVTSVQNNLKIGNVNVSLAIIELQHNSKEWIRWVFENEALNRDVVEEVPHEDTNLIDENIKMTYSPGSAPITIAAGLGDDLYLLTATDDIEKSERIKLGQTIQLTTDVTLTLDRIEPFTTVETKPAIIPKFQRDPSASNTLSMLKIEIPGTEETAAAWLPYHHYPFESMSESVYRFRYRPTILQLEDGTVLEIMYSRSSAQLPSPVSLINFEVDSHIGGFTGRTASILNWRSIIEFSSPPTETLAVSVNDPQPHEGYWFFQSQWDPPDTNSQGLNYTVLGVGNRRGVFIMLLGTCIAVLGMIWAFYIKPVIKRKRQQAVYDSIEANAK